MPRKFLATFLILAFTFTVVSAQRRRGGSEPFNPAGAYTQSESSEQQGKPSQEIYRLEVENKRGKWGGVIGFIDGRRRTTDYKIISVSMNPDAFEFTTSPMRGKSYKFKGRFLVKGNLEKAWNRNGQIAVENVMEGDLITLQVGVEISRAKVKFNYESPLGDDTEPQ